MYNSFMNGIESRKIERGPIIRLMYPLYIPVAQRCTIKLK